MHFSEVDHVTNIPFFSVPSEVGTDPPWGYFSPGPHLDRVAPGQPGTLRQQLDFAMHGRPPRPLPPAWARRLAATLAAYPEAFREAILQVIADDLIKIIKAALGRPPGEGAAGDQTA
jgi:hypothetical protein